MDADTFRRLQAIFHEALGRPEAEREAYVRAACGEDRALADEVMELLALEAAVTPRETVRPLALAAQAVEDAERRSLIGSAIGRYRIESEIASGGMGRVFKASRIDGDVRQVVALKLMRVEMFNPALLKRFSSERKILASLNHPGIAHLIDAGTDERGTPFVAMEYVDGQPLHEYCAKNLLPIRARVELFRQVLAAVAHAHRNLVVHRDLKPDNVLVTADGRVKLLDFGIAKEIDLDLQHTATAQRFFTPAYAAPEQLDQSAVSVACDVYGLGAVLYTVLTGEPPFDFSALTQGEIERTIRMVPPVPMSAALSKRDPTALRRIGIDDKARWIGALKGDLEQIVQKALRKEPLSRYPSIERFDEDIAAYLDRRPVSASGAGVWYRARKFCERNTLGVSLSAAFLVAGALAFAYVVRQNAEIRMQRDRAEMAFQMLLRTIRSADPMGLDGGDLRARDMLAEMARQVDRLESDQPALFRDLAYRIADIQLNIGMPAKALDTIRRAQRSAGSQDDEGPQSDARRLVEIRALIQSDEYAGARALIERTRGRLGRNPEFVAEDAHLMYLEKRYAPSIAVLKTLLARDAGRSDPTLTDRIYLYLAEAYRMSDRPASAVAVLDRHIEALSQRVGRDHPATLISKLRRTEPLIELKRPAQAERDLIELEPQLARVYDRNSSVFGLYHNLAGQAADEQRKSDRALAHFRRSLEINRDILGEDHQNVLRSYLNMATIISFYARDRHEAYPYFDRAIAGFERNLPEMASMAGAARLEAATSHYWDAAAGVEGAADAARRMLTPAHALDYFERMSQKNRNEYLAGLFYGFGRQDCGPGWEQAAQRQPESQRVARTLMCRYDPQALHRPVD